MDGLNRHVYEFGPFTLDIADRSLAREGENLPLTAKTFELLKTLLERRGHVVTKDELLQKVWADSFVEETSLTVCMSALRRALGDRPSASQYIETVPKLGYRFVAPVREIAGETDSDATAEGGPIHEREHAAVDVVDASIVAARRPRAFRVAAGFAAVVFGLGALALGFSARPAPVERTIAPEARMAYLKGRHFWNKRTADGLSKSIGFYRQAIEVDANYAEAYAGLADSYVFDLSDWPKAEAAARKAIELDPSLAAPHATIAFGLMFHQWDWVGAERGLRRAIELDPGYATAHQWYATWLVTHGRLEEAKHELDAARQSDPLSVSIISDQAALAYYQHDYEKAIAIASEALELDRDAIVARDVMLVSNERLRRGEEFMNARRASLEAMNGAGRIASDEAAYAAGGIKAVCLAEARMNEETWRNPDQFAYAIAQNYARAGEYETALGWLERACRNRCFMLVYVKVDPVFDEIRRHPRFADVERCVGLS